MWDRVDGPIPRAQPWSHDPVVDTVISNHLVLLHNRKSCEISRSRTTSWTHDVQVLRKKTGMSVLNARGPVPSLPFVFELFKTRKHNDGQTIWTEICSRRSGTLSEYHSWSGKFNADQCITSPPQGCVHNWSSRAFFQCCGFSPAEQIPPTAKGFHLTNRFLGRIKGRGIF